MGGRDKDELRAELSYDAAYRLRIWRAASEESAELGLGFRAYHTHILNSLLLWADEGVQFMNAKGERLELSALSQDDLWGFLGKKGSTPPGPKRQISTPKFAILDVYFKRKKSNFLSQQVDITADAALSNIIGDFLGLKESALIDPGAWRGLYVPKPDFSVRELAQHIRRGNDMRLILPVLIVSPANSRRYCHVHRVEMPFAPMFLSERYKADIDIGRIEKYLLRHSPRSIKKYSGIGLIGKFNSSTGSASIACILKDSEGPFVENLEIFSEGNEEKTPNFAYEVFGDRYGRKYHYCGKGMSYLKLPEYSQEFYERILSYGDQLASVGLY